MTIIYRSRPATALTLIEQIRNIDHLQSRRLEKLERHHPAAYEIASQGIIRHLRACLSTGCEPDTAAIREIIDDAYQGLAVYSVVDNDRQQLFAA